MGDSSEADSMAGMESSPGSRLDNHGSSNVQPGSAERVGLQLSTYFKDTHRIRGKKWDPISMGDAESDAALDVVSGLAVCSTIDDSTNGQPGSAERVGCTIIYIFQV